MVKAINPQTNDFILQADATELTRFIRSEQITIETITKTYIDHIKRVNPQLNAVVEERFDDALAEAKEKDKKLQHVNWQETPFYGVPISVKESFHVTGMHTTGGLGHRKDIMMTQDADVVRYLKRKGVIILCKTNTPTLCFGHETDNKLFGRTNNAWHQAHTAGGSSGGEAALIGVGGAAFGISSDIGGSIRFPSHFNGVIGFKPGKMQVSANGHFPADTHTLKERMQGVGPIGKSVRDVKKVYEYIQNEKVTKPFYEKMQIDMLPLDNGFPLSEATEDMMTKVHTLLTNKYEISYAIPPFFNDSALIWQEIMSLDGGKEMRQFAFNTDRVNVWKYYLKEKVTGKTKAHLHLSWALIVANMFKPTNKRIREIEQFLQDSDVILHQHLKNRLLVMPVYHRGALKHGELFKEVFSIQKTFLKYMPYTAYANVWGLPSLTIPIATDEQNMPIGIQIMGSIGNEDAIFRLGKCLETHFGSYQRSTLYD